ncbi:MAG: hypothetical protein IT244_09250, partial [Bacteroidia bacterium]|nr:hypothetical protein [Bacteroidia bacterium]
VFKFEYWIHAVLDPMGINLQYSLGKDLFKMLNFSLFLPAVAAVAILAVTIVSAISIFKSGTVKWRKPNFSSPLVFYGFAFVLIPGLLLTLSGSPVRSHYLIAAAPFIHAVFAKFWLQKGNKWFAVVLVSQAVIALCFIIFIHMHGAPNGDYGMPYRLQ